MVFRKHQWESCFRIWGWRNSCWWLWRHLEWRILVFWGLRIIYKGKFICFRLQNLQSILCLLSDGQQNNWLSIDKAIGSGFRPEMAIMQHVPRTDFSSFALFSWTRSQSMPFVSSLFSVLWKIYFLSFDGENYHSIESSKNPHHYTYGLANYKGKAMITGCGFSNNAYSFATELFDMSSLNWSDGPEFPFGTK